MDAFLISALNGDEWSTSRLYRFTPGERGPCLSVPCSEVKNLLSLPGIEPELVCHPHYADRAFNAIPTELHRLPHICLKRVELLSDI